MVGASEPWRTSLDYQCVPPTSGADYQLKAGYGVASANSGTTIRLDYELIKDGEALGMWSDTLRWNAARFTFELGNMTPRVSDSTAETVRAAIGRARTSLASAPVNVSGAANAAETEVDQMGKSGLLDVL